MLVNLLVCFGVAVNAQSLSVDNGVASIAITAAGQIQTAINAYEGDKSEIIEFIVSGTLPDNSGDILRTDFNNVFTSSVLPNVRRIDMSKLRIDGHFGFSANAFKDMTSLKSFEFPNASSISISNSCFENTGISSIIIPASVNNVGRFVFTGCTQLEQCIFLGVPATWNASGIFSTNATVKIGVTDVTAFQTAINWTMPTGGEIVPFFTIDYNSAEVSIPQSNVGIAGFPVSIKAIVPDGKAFEGWESSTAGVTFTDATDPETTFTVSSQPADNIVTISARFTGAIDYTIVDGITQSGFAAEGNNVAIETESTKGAQFFHRWEVTSGSATIADPYALSTTFTMPNAAVTITAVYRDGFAITVNDGTASFAGAPVGETVSITANTINYMEFVNWTAEPAVTFIDATNATTTFTMIGSAVTITANYNALPAKAIHVTATQKISDLLNATEQATLEQLVVTSEVDLNAADLNILNTMPELKKLDLSGTTNKNFPADAWQNNSSIESLILPAGLTGFGRNNFLNSVLKGELILPASVVDVSAAQLFQGSTGITAFVLDVAGEDNGTLKTVDGVVYAIKNWQGNPIDKTLYLYPGGKTDTSYELEEGTVSFSTNLNNPYIKELTLAEATVTMPATNRSPITNALALESVFVKAGNTKYASANGLLLDKDTKTLMYECPLGRKGYIVIGNEQLSEIIVPDSYFRGRTDITGIEYQENVSEIKGTTSIQNCNGLTLIISRSTTPPVASTNAFAGSPSGITIGVPSGSEANYAIAPWNVYSSNIVPFYDITLTNASSVQDVAVAGIEVPIEADDAPSGQVFDKWTSIPEVTFDNKTSSSTTFTMPAGNVTIEATYKEDVPTYIGNTDDTQLFVYPNPATEYIQLAGVENAEYIIYDMYGRLIASGITNGEVISISNYAAGMYIIRVEGNAYTFIKK